ncbi:MAG TPA: class I SAM-dependent methyltransferase [Patescibacteria group bacterium]
MIQSPTELDHWYRQEDPWQYETTFDDLKRKNILLSELPTSKYGRVLDIGCGHGYVTRDLPGKKVVGVDVSEKAIAQAQRYARSHRLKHHHYQTANLFKLTSTFQQPFDLIIITGVLYPQYIGQAHSLVYHVIDQLLEKSGILVSVHVDAWYKARFPYLLLKDHYYKYREYNHRLEVYVK